MNDEIGGPDWIEYYDECVLGWEDDDSDLRNQTPVSDWDNS